MVKRLYEDIEILDLGDYKFRKGELRIQLPSLIWRRHGSDRTIEIKITEIEKVTWMTVAEGIIQFDFHLSNGLKQQFTGFTPEDQLLLVNLLNREGISTREEHRVVTGQVSAALFEIKENSLVLKVDSVNKLFEIPLTDVTDIETMGAEDVKLSYHIDDTFGATELDRMEWMTFSIPLTFSQFFCAKGSSPAIEFKKTLVSFDCVRLGGEDPVATFQRLIFLSPRGVYDMHFNLQFFGLKSDDIAVTLMYRSIVSVHILPKVPKDKSDPLQQVYVVICVDPPLQMDESRHPYLVLMLKTTEQVEEPVEIHMKDELYESKFKDKLKKSYQAGCVHEIVVRLLEGLSGKKHSEIGEYGHGVWSILKAVRQSKQGSLYPLEDAFYFLSDPTKRIFYNDIINVEIKSPENGNFNLEIVLNTGRHYFSTLVDSELDNLVAFMKKNIIVNLCEVTWTKTKGFKNYKKKIEQEFPGESSVAIDRKSKNLWIETPDEVKDFYDLIG